MMTIKTLLAAAALTLTPAFAMAAGCSHGQEKQAMSCADGSVYDSASGSCKVVSG